VRFKKLENGEIKNERAIKVDHIDSAADAIIQLDLEAFKLDGTKIPVPTAKGKPEEK